MYWYHRRLLLITSLFRMNQACLPFCQNESEKIGGSIFHHCTYIEAIAKVMIDISRNEKLHRWRSEMRKFLHFETGTYAWNKVLNNKYSWFFGSAKAMPGMPLWNLWKWHVIVADYGISIELTADIIGVVYSAISRHQRHGISPAENEEKWRYIVTVD